jgi:predicted double-glycine peptidase
MKPAVAVRCLAVAALVAISCSALGKEGTQESNSQPVPPDTPTHPLPVRDPEHTFRLRVRNYVAIKEQNIVMQRRDFSCGAACLATVAKYYWGDEVSEVKVLRTLDEILTEKEIADRIKKGLAMTDLRKAAVKLGYQATVGRTTFTKLTESRVPVIVGISPSKHDHFVVFRGSCGDWVYVADPIRGNIRMTTTDFTKQWQKNGLLVIHKPGQKVRTTSPLSLRLDEISLGELNDQLIRTQPQRQPPTLKGQL